MKRRIVIVFMMCVFLCCLLSMTAGAKEYKSQWVKSKGQYSYYNKNGKKVKGIKKLGSQTFYFDKKGIQHVGWQKISGEYYFFTIAKGKKGSLVKADTVNGIKIRADGKAVKTKDSLEKLELMIRANQIVESLTNWNMTSLQKLKTCYKYTIDTYEYIPVRPFKNRKNWERIYCRDMFSKGRGNCLSLAAAFGYMANAIGYHNINVICFAEPDGHGYCEIAGKIYDPQQELEFEYSFFRIPYSVSNKPFPVKRERRPTWPNYKVGRVYVARVD